MQRRRESVVPVVHALLALTGQVLQLVATAVALYSSVFYWGEQRPYHTSALTGQMWVNELIHGHPERIRTELGVHLHIFVQLILELRAAGYADSCYVTLEEQLAIFLYTCVTGLTIRHIGERFQRSNETISEYFRLMLGFFSSPAFYNEYVRLPLSTDAVPAYIRSNSKLWPYFKDCIGAMDGSHIACWAAADDQSNMRNRKGFLSQNILAVCNFAMFFIYILAGWDSSVTDSFLYSDARVNDLPVPPGRYYLGDAGFPLCASVLIPYRSTRYHLREWQLGNAKPRTKQELFNLRHAQARNVVERIFGVIKARWQVLVVPARYKMETQAKIPAALAALHNFITKYDPLEEIDPEAYDPEPGIRGDGEVQEEGTQGELSQLTEEESAEGTALRERIADEMWADYLLILAERGEAINEDEDDMDVD